MCAPHGSRAEHSNHPLSNGHAGALLVQIVAGHVRTACRARSAIADATFALSLFDMCDPVRLAVPDRRAFAIVTRS